FRWGAGSLQEIDHVPLVAPVTKHAATVTATDDIAGALHHAALTALRPHRGPVFPALPLGVVSDKAAATLPADSTVESLEPDPDEVAKAAALVAAAQRPVIIAGSDVYAADAIAALREAAETLQVPVFTNGMGRGSLPPGHPLAFTKARRAALKGADVVAV